MNRKISLEKHICKCGNIMEYDGLETSIMSDIDENNKILSDLDIYIYENCGYKVWVHATEHCEILQF
mgnify:CR=1 FL=1